MLKIRNPHGNGEWQGDWSDHSPLWTESLKQKLGYVDKDDGVFFMAYSDYYEIFKITTICYEKNSKSTQKLYESSCYHDYAPFNECKDSNDPDLL
jgi:hypothetical protein